MKLISVQGNMVRSPVPDLHNSSCLLALVFASTDDIYNQVQKTEASKEPEEVIKMPFVQVVRNPSRVTSPCSKVRDHCQNERAEIVPTRSSEKIKCAAEAPHGVW